MISSQAFSPGHITGLFSIRDGEQDPYRCGSIGAGFSIQKGVQSSVTPLARQESQDDRFLVNGHIREDLEVSRRILELYREQALLSPKEILQISHTIDIPQGSGFGSSGAGALSLSMAINHGLGDPISPLAAGDIAHRAELDCKTGLGTVIGEYFGGFEIRSQAGSPSQGKILRFCDEAAGENLHFLFIVFKKISTSKTLSNPETRKHINRVGEKLLKELIATPEIDHFFYVSRQFSEKTGLITDEVRRIFSYFDERSIPCSMLMFGNAVFACFRDKSMAKKELETLSSLEKKGYLFLTTPSSEGGRIVE